MCCVGATVAPVLPLTKWSVVLGSFSKTLSLAGERVGYIALNPAMPDVATLVAAVTLTNRTLGYVNAPVIGQRLAAQLLDATVDLGIYDRRRRLMAEVLSAADGWCWIRYEGREGYMSVEDLRLEEDLM